MSDYVQKNVWNGYKKPTRNRRVLQREKRLSGNSYQTVKTRKEKPAKVPPSNVVSVL